jgi:nicotinate-nucleotide--dimethylbenzimidazole phosphoribosyltransferase
MNAEQLNALCARIAPIDAAAAARAQARLDAKTKPRRSLGRLEDLACQVAGIRGSDELAPGARAIVVMAGDHGVAEEGVSAYPQDVTGQMVLNFARGGAAINVLARHVGARVVVADLGVKAELPPTPEIRSLRVAPGTRNFTREPAMTRAQALQAIGAGAGLAAELGGEGVSLLGIGEMGIGNTTAASALTCALTGAPVEEVTGRGTGIDDAGWQRKLGAIRRGLERHATPPGDALGTLAALGGFEIAGLAGVVLGAAAARRPVVVDGFIASVAALAAVRLAPVAAAYLLPSHRSVEVGHRVVLQALGLRPLLDLDMRLGEGTCAALAMNLVDAALHLLAEMATFSQAGVSDTGR